MSSAANDKRGHLENEFQRRMHDAEASPSPDLWARIDHDLTIQESKHYKGRMVLYRQLAAACFVLFMLAGALLTYHYKAENSIDAGIASMQLDNESGSITDKMADVREGAANPSAQLPENETYDKNLAAGAAATEGTDLTGTDKHARRNINYSSIAGSGKAATQSINAETANNRNAGSIGAASGTTKYSLNSAVAVAAEPSATINNESIFGLEDETTVSRSVSSRFDVGRPFFQTARQAITSVPSSYTSEQSIASETGRTRSLVELSQTAVSDYLAKQKKVEEVAIALNTPATGSEKDEKEATKDNRWSLGLGYAPSYFNQNIQMPNQMMTTVNHRSFAAGGPDKTDESSYNMNQARDEFEANTDPAFSYAAEVKAGFKLYKKIKLLAGIGFTQNTARTKSSYILNQFVYKPGTDQRVAMPATTVFLPSLNNNFTTDSLSVKKTDEFYVNYRYRHITLPVGLQYEGNISKNWFWYGAGGVAANFLVETTVMASTHEVKDVSYGHSDDSPFRKVQFSGNVSAGLGKRVSNVISVTAGPEFRGYLNSLLAEPEKALAPQGNPYTIGINMSVNYNLGQK
ncbi:hypothetical protein ABID22_001825 [Pontibacter aydingkolensis]|uniref:PorT family protein n=1 Tax=Pontibacter aydingkolensis TaxID=1911536 RepID=A0ABS7CPM1_9BACT|nr:outer membrane beta-barrel protein [Pontibacter aydingkolensis]MBW7465789.1 PorT family protein [Pontibacter aydingkolensis]